MSFSSSVGNALQSSRGRSKSPANSTPDPVRRWKAAQRSLMAEGLDLAAATRQLIDTEPELHSEYLATVKRRQRHRLD